MCHNTDKRRMMEMEGTAAKTRAPDARAACTLARLRKLVRTNAEVARAVEILKGHGIDVEVLVERNEKGSFEERPRIEDIMRGKGFI